MDKDLEQIRLLSIFHYVLAAMAAVLSLIPMVHLTVGLGLVSGAMGDSDPTARMVGGLFALIGAGAVLCGWAFAVCMVIAGRKLVRLQSYTFCMVMAAVACMFMPFGTVLGVFTIIVLMRDSVRAQFGVADRPAPAQAPPTQTD